MFPILLRIQEFSLAGMTFGPWEIHWYGTLITLGFILVVWLAMREGKRTDIDPDKILDLSFWVLLAGLIGSRVVFDIVNWRSYYNACFDPAAAGIVNANCTEILKIWKGGLVWYGGLLGAIPVGFWFMKRHKMPLMKVSDALIPSVSLAHGFGRLGCFAAGCCFGRPTTVFTGVTFPETSMTHELHAQRWPDLLAQVGRTLPVHPTQLYEALGEVAIFFILITLRTRKRFHGQVFLTYLILYPLLRSVVEFFRGDHSRGYVVSWDVVNHFGAQRMVDTAGVSTSQFISILMAAAALVAMVILLRRNRRDRATDLAQATGDADAGGIDPA